MRNPQAHRERELARYYENREEVLDKRAAWYRKNRERVLARKRERREARPELDIFTRAKARAKKRGLPFTITLRDVVIPERCPILGIRLDPLRTEKGPCSPSLDRIDSARGYEPGNVAVISDRANTLKNDGTASEHRLIAAWMEDRNVP